MVEARERCSRAGTSPPGGVETPAAELCVRLPQTPAEGGALPSRRTRSLTGFIVLAGLLGCRDGTVVREPVDIAATYAGTLTLLGEPDLQRTADERSMFRMLWLRSFHGPVAVRLVRDDERYSVITVEVENRPDGSTGPAQRDSLPLDATRWDHILLLANLREFWTLQVPGDPPGVVGLDGAQWIVEARHGGVYHAVDWWSPSPMHPFYSEAVAAQAGAFRDLALRILSLGTVCVKPDAVY